MSDRRGPAFYVSIACVVLIAAVGLWFVLGRNHHTASATAAGTHAAPRTLAPRPPTPKQRAQANRAVQNDLRNALTAEKVIYVDQQVYVASPAALRPVEPSIAWGTRMHVTVADAASRGDHGVVCLSEKTRYGATYSVADVAAGPTAGTYLGPKPCPTPVTARSVTALGTTFGR